MGPYLVIVLWGAGSATAEHSRVDMPSRYWAGLVGLVAAVAVATVWYGRSAPESAPLELGFATPSEAASITVHVSGEVVSPGLVRIASSSRVADAVAAAGGSTRGADLARVNLAATVRDGEQVVIPGIVAGPGSGAAVDGEGKVRINSASASELEQLPGVGPVLAGRIAAYRDDNGPFSAVEDLLDVPGIGEGKLATMRDAVALP